MTLAHEVTDALNKAGFKNLLKAYSFQRLKNPDPDHAVITVFEVSNTPVEHGSNIYNQLDQRIQLKILFNNPTNLDADAFVQSIASFLFKQKIAWLRLPDNGFYIDATDTKPMLAIDMFFRRRK